MSRTRVTNPGSGPAAGPSFLLSQLGAHAAIQFAERLAPLNLTPPHAGILRAISRSDGLGQQALGGTLGMFPSRLVLALDELEQRGLLERRENPKDRRSHSLYLTEAGREVLAQIGRIAREHQDVLCAALDESERAQLTEYLTRIAAQQQLTPGIHPGFRKLGGKRSK
jgi:DNA-binding MarR family transcriptional regulator